jgi:hypothetical protein
VAEDLDDLDAREKRVRRLLGWASLLLLIALCVAGLDVMIKNEILRQAKESQSWLDRLRQDVMAGGESGTAAADSGQPDQPGDPGLDGVEHAAARRPARPRKDGGS